LGLRIPIQASAAARAALADGGVPRALLRSGARAVLRSQDVAEAEVSLTLLGDEEIADLNRRYLQHEGPTDVISFALFEPPEPVLGDVYIGAERARAQALARNIPLGHELLRLAVHGTLHVLGHDHPAGEGRTRSRMWRVQERILEQVLTQ
jgi:probable rRNA maturation factor